jgi:AcrR family transcriptional regulator
LLETSLKLFSQEGYDATGVAQICLAAGVSKGAFYHHFPSKQAIFLELLHSWLAALDVQILSVKNQTQNVPQALREMTGLMALVFREASGYLPMFLEFWAHASRDPLVWQAVISPYRRYEEYFESLVHQGIAEGSLRNINPSHAARAIVAIAVGLLLQGILDQQGIDWAEASRQSMELLLESVVVIKSEQLQAL